MPRFRPDIKPPMWGPLDAVRFGVRANCDRIGINYAAIDGYWPLLEFGGKTVVDIAHGTKLSVAGNADWSPLGVRVYSSTGSSISGLSTKINAAATSQTCFAWLANISAFSANDARIFTNRASWNDTQGFSLETASSRLRFRHNTPSGRVDILSTVDIRQGMGPVNYRQNDPLLFGVAYGPGSCDFFLDAKNVPADTVSHASSGIVASVRNFSIGNGIDFVNNLTVMSAFVSHEKLSKEIVERLAYEPYTLLMPVARPVYFDLGASAGTDNLTATDLVTSSPVLGTPALGQVHALTATVLTTSAPVLGTPALGQVHGLTATGLTAAVPVLGTPALTENAPDIDALTAVDLVVGSPVLGAPALGQVHVLGSDGLVTGAPVLGSPSITQIHTLEAIGLTVGVPVLGAPALNGSDIVLITAAEVARIVRATSRMKTVTASARVKQVRYEVTRA